MPLPAANRSILAANFYPDRIAIVVRVALRSSESAFNLTNLLLRGRWQRHNSAATTDLVRLGVSLSAKRLTEPMHVSIIAYYNPLAIRHRYATRRAPPSEHSSDGSSNWLPETAISRDMRPLWREVGETLWLIGVNVVSLCDDLLDAQGDGPPVNLLGVTLLEVEAAYDFAMRFPKNFVASRQAQFVAHFSAADYSEYVRAGRIALQPGPHDVSLTAYPYSGEKAKLYSKTNRRVRFEVSMSRAALRRIGVTRREIDGEHSFPQMFAHVAARAASVATMILASDEQGSSRQQEGPIELLIALVRRVRDIEKIYAFIDALASSGRVTATWDRHVPGRLLRDGVLMRRARGVYVLGERYREAGEALTRMVRLGHLERPEPPIARSRPRVRTRR